MEFKISHVNSLLICFTRYMKHRLGDGEGPALEVGNVFMCVLKLGIEITVSAVPLSFLIKDICN